MAPVHTQAILLRSHPYGETSRVLRFYSRDLGVVGVMARGIRTRGSKGGAAGGTFSSGVLTVYLKEGRGLQTLKDFSPRDTRTRLGGDLVRFSAASVLAELVLRHAGEEGNPELYDLLERSLDVIGEAPAGRILPLLLALGWSLVTTLGWAPLLGACVLCGRALEEEEMGRFDFSQGGVRCADCAGEEGGPRIGPGAREQLGMLLAGRAPDELRLPEAHLSLFSDFVTYHVSGGRPLDSLRVLQGTITAGGSVAGSPPAPPKEEGTDR